MVILIYLYLLQGLLEEKNSMFPMKVNLIESKMFFFRKLFTNKLFTQLSLKIAVP